MFWTLFLIGWVFAAVTAWVVAGLAFLSIRAEGLVLLLLFHPKGGEKK